MSRFGFGIARVRNHNYNLKNRVTTVFKFVVLCSEIETEHFVRAVPSWVSSIFQTFTSTLFCCDTSMSVLKKAWLNLLLDEARRLRGLADCVACVDWSSQKPSPWLAATARPRDRAARRSLNIGVCAGDAHLGDVGEQLLSANNAACSRLFFFLTTVTDDSGTRWDGGRAGRASTGNGKGAETHHCEN